MKFIDLFSGLGGFHIALKRLGFKCVFASEINTNLRQLYEENFKIECLGDIRKIEAPNIPKHNILCAGFPCQPFSKAGKQLGMKDSDQGRMIYKIAHILECHQPEYFILENVPNLRRHNRGQTWSEIFLLLQRCNYYVEDFVLSPHQFNIPNKRERLFIIGKHYSVSDNDTSNIKEKILRKLDQRENTISQLPELKSFLSENENHNVKKLSQQQFECLGHWNQFIKRFPGQLPKFPIWLMEFGATYPLESKTPFYMSQEELSYFKGSFGQTLKGKTKQQQLKLLPIYAIYDQETFPKWKINYIRKNRNFWKMNQKYIQDLVPPISQYPNSWQKFEWNVGNEGHRDIFKYLLQFRSSGIRVKNSKMISSLVLTHTQRPIIGWKKRYLSLQEAQKLQGFESININFLENQAFKALGNSVHPCIVQFIIENLIPIKNDKKKCIGDENLEYESVRLKKSIKMDLFTPI